jgi:hypothetical protein
MKASGSAQNLDQHLHVNVSDQANIRKVMPRFNLGQTAGHTIWANHRANSTNGGIGIHLKLVHGPIAITIVVVEHSQAGLVNLDADRTRIRTPSWHLLAVVCSWQTVY